jgi:hypothetical protein
MIRVPALPFGAESKCRRRVTGYFLVKRTF